jgi:hypothetical protein
MVLEKHREDQFDTSCEILSITKNKIGEEYPTNNKKKAKGIGNTLRRKCRLKHVNEGKIGAWTEVMRRRGRIRKRLLDSLK